MTAGLVEVGALFDGEAVSDGPVTIEIDAGRVVSVGRPDDYAAGRSRLLRLPAATALPGLVDTHVHLQLSGAPERSLVREQFTADRADGRLDERARANARAALASGVTTVRDCGSTVELLALRDEAARPGASAIAATALPRIVACGPPLTTPSGQLWWMGALATDAAEVRAAASRVLDEGADALKIMASGGLLTTESDPHRPQYPPDALRAAVEVAHGRARRIVAHATAAEAIVAAAEAGVDAIDHALWHGPDGDDAWTEAGADRVAASGATLGFTAAGRLRSLLDDAAGRAEIRRQAATHRRFAARGVRIGVHSDAGGSRTRFQEVAESLAVAAVGLDRRPVEVLRMVTAQAAAELGLTAEVGAIRPGRSADIVIVEGDPLDDLAALRSVAAVFREGRLVAGTVMTTGVAR